MRPKTLILMLVAVSCGLVASFMTSRYLSAQQQEVVVEEEKVPVLVARRKIDAFHQLNDPEAFEVRMFAISNATKDAIGDFEEVKGRVLKNALEAGKPLAESDLLEEGLYMLDYKLRPGEVAMSVKLNPESAVSGFIVPGSRVDVVATVTRAVAGTQPYTKVILQNVEVLAINQQMTAHEGVANQSVDRATLRVTHAQAEELANYADTGTLKLLLRRFDDPTVYETPGFRIGSNPGEHAGEHLVQPSEDATNAPDLTAPEVPEDIVPVATGPQKPKHSGLVVIDGFRVRKYFTDEEDKSDKDASGKDDTSKNAAGSTSRAGKNKAEPKDKKPVSGKTGSE